ncbi:MAG: phage minor capsid protein [Clostridium cadaveris]|uniref:Toxin 50 n=1 Tax=Clostridium cadaveris TaxID=1529 RepID=A0A1I2KNR0_9CLOT|nr:phage minor capsid protein [Clostridium cadaveris]MDY4950308.1 phage minor capsid protein [Clostridium cadaveris]SFF68624.1 toxin 50 [Clostridium cadaveris]
MDKKNKPTQIGEILKNVTKKYAQDEAKKERDKSYDVRKIFEQMELDLISSMHKAFYFHQREEEKEGFRFEQWQLVKLREMEKYRKRNKDILGEYKVPIEKVIQETLQQSFDKGQQNVETHKGYITGEIKFPQDEIKEEVKKSNNSVSEHQEIEGDAYNKATDIEELPKAPREEGFFDVNEKKLKVLMESVNNDLNKAEYAVLRKMDDVYRQTIFKTHMYLQNGVKTLNQAIDMSTKDFLDKGINSIQYKNGANVNIASYAEMALRTANHRAMLLGEGSKRDEYGIHLVVVSAHANTCPKCEPWQGKILIDDVFSHPNKEYIEKYRDKYKLVSEAIEKGLLHPNCRHSLITYFEGVTRIPTVPDGKEAIKVYEAEQKQRALERKIRKWKRFEAGTLDEENKLISNNKVKKLQSSLRKHLKNNKELRKKYDREKARAGLNINDSSIEAEVLKEKVLNAKIKEIREYIRSKQPLKIEIGKQGKHILGHNNYIEGRSYLTISLEEAQELINKYAGTGEIKFTLKGEWDKKETITIDKEIGVNVSMLDGLETKTNSFKIHYSKKGTHIVPN